MRVLQKVRSCNPGASRHRESDEGTGLFLGIAGGTGPQLLKVLDSGQVQAYEPLQKHDAEAICLPSLIFTWSVSGGRGFGS